LQFSWFSYHFFSRKSLFFMSKIFFDFQHDISNDCLTSNGRVHWDFFQQCLNFWFSQAYESLKVMFEHLGKDWWNILFPIRIFFHKSHEKTKLNFICSNFSKLNLPINFMNIWRKSFLYFEQNYFLFKDRNFQMLNKIKFFSLEKTANHKDFAYKIKVTRNSSFKCFPNSSQNTSWNKILSIVSFVDLKIFQTKCSYNR
jgi:hypothetical protein